MTLFPVKKEKSKRESRRERKIRKREKARSEYMRSLTRKPKYLREVLRVFPILLVLMLVADYVLTKLAAADFIGGADSAIERYQNEMDEIFVRNTTLYEKVDFNQLFQPAAGVSATDRENLYRAVGELSFRINSGSYDIPESYSSFFDRIWQTYSFQNITKLNNFELPFWVSAFSAVYNTEGQQIADQSAGICMIMIQDPNGDKDGRIVNVYSLDIERLEEKHPGLFDQIKTHYNHGEDAGLYFKDLYIRDYTMLPTEIGIQGGDMPSITFDLSDCDFSGYTKVTQEDLIYPSDTGSSDCMGQDGTTLRILGPVLMGNYVMRVNHEEFYKQLDKKEIAENVKLAVQEQREVYSLTRTAYKVSGYVCKPAQNGSLVSVVAVDYDFFRDWKGILVRAYGLNLAAALLIGLFWRWLRYQKRRLSYEVDAYRRRTTDAVAHDLKSPLMAISGYVENIASHVEPAKTKYYAGNILSAVKDMDRMIGNILDLSRLEESKRGPELRKTALRRLVEEQAEKYEPCLQEKELSFIVEGESLVCADEEQMRHLIDNLLSNAVRYACRESEIQVRLSREELSVRNAFDYELSVEPKELLAPFVKGDAARSDTHGSGLGLSIVDRIAQVHGFHVEIMTEDQFFEVRLILR